MTLLVVVFLLGACVGVGTFGLLLAAWEVRHGR